MSDRDEVAEVLWRASDDNDDPDLTWENNYVRDEWYRMADALLASDWLARLKAEARAAGVEEARRIVLDCADRTADFVKDKGLRWAAHEIRAALAARSDQDLLADYDPVPGLVARGVMSDDPPEGEG